MNHCVKLGTLRDMAVSQILDAAFMAKTYIREGI